MPPVRVLRPRLRSRARSWPAPQGRGPPARTQPRVGDENPGSARPSPLDAVPPRRRAGARHYLGARRLLDPQRLPADIGWRLGFGVGAAFQWRRDRCDRWRSAYPAPANNCPTSAPLPSAKNRAVKPKPTAENRHATLRSPGIGNSREAWNATGNCRICSAGGFILEPLE
jgi:hypothetical protein